MNLDGVETHFTYDDWGRTASKYVGDGSVLHAFSVIARKESSTDEAIWASAGSFESRCEHVLKGLPSHQIASSLEDSLFAMTNNANPAMEREWYRYDAGWNVVGRYADDPAGFWDIGGLESAAVWHGRRLPASGGPLAEVTGSTPNGAYRHATHEHLGSTRSLFDANKHAVGAIEYTPYGLPLVTAGVTPEYTFTGKPFDAEVSMYHFPYRQYSPESARWLTRDPLGMVDGPNVYAYVRGNPTKYSDRYGLSIVDVAILLWLAFDCYLKANQLWDYYAETLPHEDVYPQDHPYNARNSWLRHCTASCELKESNGAACAYLLGTLYEYLHNGGRNFEQEDLDANRAGRDCTDDCSKVSCFSCCDRKWKDRNGE